MLKIYLFVFFSVVLFSLVNDVDIRCFIYDRYGKGFIKKQRLSPDAYLQIAYQLTFYR